MKNYDQKKGINALNEVRPAQLERILPRKNDIISKLVPTIALPVLESSANYSWFKTFHFVKFF